MTLIPSTHHYTKPQPTPTFGAFGFITKRWKKAPAPEFTEMKIGDSGYRIQGPGIKQFRRWLLDSKGENLPPELQGIYRYLQELKASLQYTSLQSAIDKNERDTVENLLLLGANPNEKGVWPPLVSAVNENNLDIVKLLIEEGADLNATTNSGVTALAWAVYKGFKEVATFLIDAGTNLNLPCENGWTPLMRAACDGHQDLVEKLIQAGADINVKNYSGLTALRLAKTKEIRELLIKAGATPSS
jgi:hypothetical protein